MKRRNQEERELRSAVSFRRPMSIREIKCLRNGDAYPVCPRCHITMEREYQNFCDRCGQALDWDAFEGALIVLAP